MDENEQQEERTLTPEESLRLIERQRAVVERKLGTDPLVFYVPWGLVWLIGYGLFFLRYGPNGDPLVPMPIAVPGIVLGALIVLALAITMTAAARAGRGVSGESDQRGLYYGLSWALAFTMMGVLGGQLNDHLPGPEAALYWTATSTSILTVLYVAGAAVWRDRSMFVLGCWVGVINVIGVIAGVGWHSLLVSLGGGGGLLVVGVVLRLRMRGRER